MLGTPGPHALSTGRGTVWREVGVGRARTTLTPRRFTTGEHG